MHTTAIVECRVCGAERLLGVDVPVTSTEVAEFADAHATHASFQIQLRLGLVDHDVDPVIAQRRVGDPSLQGL